MSRNLKFCKKDAKGFLNNSYSGATVSEDFKINYLTEID